MQLSNNGPCARGTIAPITLRIQAVLELQPFSTALNQTPPIYSLYNIALQEALTIGIRMY